MVGGGRLRWARRSCCRGSGAPQGVGCSRGQTAGSVLDRLEVVVRSVRSVVREEGCSVLGHRN